VADAAHVQERVDDGQAIRESVLGLEGGIQLVHLLEGQRGVLRGVLGGKEELAGPALEGARVDALVGKGCHDLVILVHFASSSTFSLQVRCLRGVACYIIEITC
jgi:hypothetical protein